MDVAAEPCLTDRRPAVPAALRFAPWLALAALFAVALVLRHLLAANTDVSWLLTVAERVLDGQRLYVDVIETNPPMAVLTYIPGIEIARAFGWPVEMVTDGLVFVAIFVSLAIVARILKNSMAMRDVAGWPLALLAFTILAILPSKTFGQREQIAVIELLPVLALYVVRSSSERPPFWAILVAGIGAGLAVSFKPHFIIGVGCGVAALAIYARSWRMLLAPENFIAGAFAAAWLLCTIVFYPAYFSFIVPLVRDIYILVGVSAVEMIQTPAVPVWAAATFAALVLRRNGRIDGALVLLLATSFGFMLVYFLQGKGWPYHSYPMIAFAMLGLGYGLSVHGRRDRALRLFAIATLAVAFVQSVLWFNWAFDKAFDFRPLWAQVARLGPHPKILAITAEPGLGHPLTRALNGTWVSRQQGLWIAAYLRNPRNGLSLDPQRKAALEVYAAGERASLIADIKANPPTVVLVDNFSDNWSRWLTDHPDVAGLLADYRLVATINDIEIRAKPH